MCKIPNKHLEIDLLNELKYVDTKKPVDLSKHFLVWMHNESKTQKSSDENLIVEIYNREQIRDLKKS